MYRRWYIHLLCLFWIHCYPTRSSARRNYRNEVPFCSILSSKMALGWGALAPKERLILVPIRHHLSERDNPSLSLTSSSRVSSIWSTVCFLKCMLFNFFIFFPVHSYVFCVYVSIPIPNQPSCIFKI